MVPVFAQVAGAAGGGVETRSTGYRHDMSNDLITTLADCLEAVGVQTIPVDFNPDGGRTGALMTDHGASLLFYENAAAAARDSNFSIEAIADTMPGVVTDEEARRLAETLLVTSASGRITCHLPMGFDEATMEIAPDNTPKTQSLLACLADH